MDVSKRLPPTSAAYVTVRSGAFTTLTRPSFTVSFSIGASRFEDARLSNSRRAAAPAWRICGPARSSVRLAEVRPWSTDFSVSPISIRIFDMGTSSSSATICPRAVPVPVPRSTLLVKTVTVPSEAMAIQESSWSGERPPAFEMGVPPCAP